jgi:hypothetical protein
MMGERDLILSGVEVRFVCAALACALPTLDETDYEVADMIVEKALAALPEISADERAAIEAKRVPPAERFWNRLLQVMVRGVPFDMADAAVLTQTRPSLVVLYLPRLQETKRELRRVNPDLWLIERVKEEA